MTPSAKKPRVPSLRHHKASGRAIVTLSGQTHYCGRWDTGRDRPTAAAQRDYEALIGRWLAGDRRPLSESDAGPTIEDCMARYWVRCTHYYRDPSGHSTGECEQVKYGLRAARRLFGTMRAADFGAPELRTLQQHLIGEGLARSTINARVDHVRRMIRWCEAEGMVPAGRWQHLLAVQNLKRGRSEARETEPVRPVSEADVRATVENLPPVVADMIWAGWWTGCRPSEITGMRWCEIDRSETPWVYRPTRHKNAHRKHVRAVPLGPRAREILQRHRKIDDDAFVFSPAHSEEQRNATRRAARRTRITPSQASRARNASRRHPPRDHYDVRSFARAIRRAVEIANRDLPDDQQIEPWSPNMLRHAAATRIRKEHGIEAARLLLGHARTACPDVYAEVDHEAAAKLMERLG